MIGGGMVPVENAGRDQTTLMKHRRRTRAGRFTCPGFLFDAAAARATLTPPE
jgi:hypothetical protein